MPASTKVPITQAQWNRVAKHLRKAGLPKPTLDIVQAAFNIDEGPHWRCRPVTTDLVSKVVVLRRKGLSQYEIAQQVERSRGTVQYILRKHSL